MSTKFEQLKGVMCRLRGADGCPWDREQTHLSLRSYLIEEAYEVLEAIDGADDRKLAEELGDLLLQIVFHSQIAQEEGRFDIEFWQEQGDQAIFNAALDMIMDYLMVRHGYVDKPRLQRTVESFRKA